MPLTTASLCTSLVIDPLTLALSAFAPCFICAHGLTRVESITDWKAGLTTSLQAIDDILEQAHPEVSAFNAAVAKALQSLS